MELFDRFLQERLYLNGVSPATIRYYHCVRRAFLPVLNEPTKAGMMACIQAHIEKGVSAISVNCYLRGFKAYVRWLHAEKLIAEIFKVQFLRTEQKVLVTFSPEQVRVFLTYRPVKGINEKRIWMLGCLLFDTGLRVTEALNLKREHVDFDNLVLKVVGKGNKHRVVPFSNELRKRLWRYSVNQKADEFIFGTGRRTRLTSRNYLRDFKALGNTLGITGVRISAHTCRHTFAVNYLRAGGNLEFLRRILGHSSILTTQKYLKSLGVEDLQKVHDGLSLLSR